MAVAADVMCRLNPDEVSQRKWACVLNNAPLSYDGREQGVAEKVTARQIESGLPPEGLAASLDLLPLVDDETRAASLYPETVRLDDAEVTGSWEKPRFWANSAEDVLAVKRLLVAHGVAVPVPRREVWCWKKRPVLNGFFGVVKADCKDVPSDHPTETRKLRGI